MAKPVTRRRKRPSAPTMLGKLIGDITTGLVKDKQESLPPSRNELRRVMSALGKIGGPKGGRARAISLSKKSRVEIAKRGAAARWGKKNENN